MTKVKAGSVGKSSPTEALHPLTQQGLVLAGGSISCRIGSVDGQERISAPGGQKWVGCGQGTLEGVPGWGGSLLLAKGLLCLWLGVCIEGTRHSSESGK